jgi:glutaredoxin
MKHVARSLGLLAGLTLCAALPAQAMYKVVAPDGRVTYTDTPPPPSSGTTITQLGENHSVTPQVALPLELREAASRFPVTLYTMRVCEPCDSARQMLRSRGVPFEEKLVISGEDGESLQRITGARDAPTLTIGTQVLRGLSAGTWNEYLDSAGYPRESRLPANYEYPVAVPLTEPAASAVAAPSPATAEPPPLPPPPVRPSPSGIKF